MNDVEPVSPQHSTVTDDRESIKRAASMASYPTTLFTWLTSLFSTTSPKPHSHSHRTLPLATAFNEKETRTPLSVMLSRGVLVATFAACTVAGVLFLSLTTRAEFAVEQQGSSHRNRYDARILAEGGRSGSGTGVATGTPASSWWGWGLSGLTGGRGVAAQDTERQLQEKMQLSGLNGLNSSEPRRVALLFFGLPRSLKYTLPSIQKHLFRPLRDTGYTPTVFLHTFDGIGVYSSEQWKLLQPFDHVVTSQKDFLAHSKCGSP